MRDSLLVFCGAGLGGVLRHGLNQLSLRLALFGFPWMTLFINVTGSLTMGLLAGFLAGFGYGRFPQSLRLFLATGVLGGYTTFSTFSLESALLIERGAYGLAVFYSLASVGLGVGGLFLGLAVTRSLS